MEWKKKKKNSLSSLSRKENYAEKDKVPSLKTCWELKQDLDYIRTEGIISLNSTIGNRLSLFWSPKYFVLYRKNYKHWIFMFFSTGNERKAVFQTILDVNAFKDSSGQHNFGLWQNMATEWTFVCFSGDNSWRQGF